MNKVTSPPDSSGGLVYCKKFLEICENALNLILCRLQGLSKLVEYYQTAYDAQYK